MNAAAATKSGGDTDYLTLSFLFDYLLTNIAGALEHIALIAVGYTVVCLTLYHLLFKRFGNILISKIRFPRYNRILIVIAHPDDECMFFGPTILSLTRRSDCQVYLLCLSNGNYEKLGRTRKEELWNACKVLNINQERITLYNATLLQDDPSLEWKSEIIAKIILHHIESLGIDALITFDRDGVSNHPNHSAIYYAVASLCLAAKIPKTCKIFTLDSINLFRKYMAILDLPISFLMSSNWFVVNWNDYKLIKSAMRQHKSQMKWFRKIYVSFSRYMTINTLREINLSDIELEMQIQEF